MTAGGVERALADLVGGWEGPESLFELACLRLSKSVRELGDETARFRTHPAGALHRLEVFCRDALRTAELAVELSDALDSEAPTEERAAGLAALLLERARALAAERVA